MRPLVSFVIIIFLGSGCSKKTSTDASPVVGVAPVAAAHAPTMDQGQADIFSRMETEAPHKDQADPPTTKVIAALTRAGMTVTQQAQHLGKPMGATYCLGVDFAEQLKTTICEYADPAAAAANAELSRKNFAAIANRSVHVKRATTLTVIELPADESSAASHKKALAAFDAL